MDSIRVEYERVMELLEQAEDLEQILALESKLSDLRYEINSYESRIRTYDNLIDYSTVHLNIDEVEFEQEVKNTVGNRIKNGFQNSIHRVENFFVDAFVFVVSNILEILILGVGLGVVIVIIKKVIQKRKMKKMMNDYEEKEGK